MPGAPLNVDAYVWDVAVLAANGALLHLPRASAVYEEQPEELSATLRFTLPNVLTTQGPMRELVRAGTPFYLSVVERGPRGAPEVNVASAALAGSAWDPASGGTPGGFAGGQGRVELMRGTIIEVEEATDTIDLVVMGHDALFTLLKHDIDLYVPAGQSFAEALAGLVAAWGIELGRVDGPEAILGGNTWRGQEAGKVLGDLLAEAVGEGAGQFVLRTTGNALEIVAPGTNTPTYHLAPGQGAGVTSYAVSIAELVQEVTVMVEVDPPKPDKKDDDTDDGGDVANEYPQGDSGRPAPTQLVTSRSSDAGFNGARRMVYATNKYAKGSADLEAQAMLAEHGFPDWRFEHTTVDVPFVRKWDRIYISDDLVDSPFFVTGVTHNISDGTMRLTLMTPEDFARKGQQQLLAAQVAKLRGQEEAAESGFGKLGSGAGAGAIQKLRAAAQSQMGKPYVWASDGGRSDFSGNAAGYDCSGFVAYMSNKLGAPGLPAFTDSIASVTTLIATNSTEGAQPGDVVLYWDGGATQREAQYPHVAMYLEGSAVLESGGSVKPSGVGVGHILTGYPRYEIRRYPPLAKALQGGGKDVGELAKAIGA